MWVLIYTLWPCPSAGSWGVSSQGNRRGRPQSQTSGWIPQSHSAWRQWWATGRCGECWSPSPSLNSPASTANTGQTRRRYKAVKGERKTQWLRSWSPWKGKYEKMGLIFSLKEEYCWDWVNPESQLSEPTSQICSLSLPYVKKKISCKSAWTKEFFTML